MSEYMNGLTHSDPRNSETRSLIKIAPHIGRMKGDIIDQISRTDEMGITPDEYAQATGCLINTVRRRFTELWKEGYMTPTNRTRDNIRGNPETVWVLGMDSSMRISRETKDQKIKRLESRIAELEALNTRTEKY